MGAIIVILSFFLLAWYFRDLQQTLERSGEGGGPFEDLGVPGVQEEVGQMLEGLEPREREVQGWEESLKELLEEAEKLEEQSQGQEAGS